MRCVVVVSVAPIIDKSAATSRSAAEVGSTAFLKCRAEGEPKPKFIWTRVSRSTLGSTVEHKVDQIDKIVLLIENLYIMLILCRSVFFANFYL